MDNLVQFDFTGVPIEEVDTLKQSILRSITKVAADNKQKLELEKRKYQAIIDSQNDLLNIRIKANEVYKENKDFGLRHDTEEPIRKWANDCLKIGVKALGKTMYAGDLKEIALNNERAACKVSSKDNPNYEKESNEACKIYEDEHIYIGGLIDYDYGYSLLKYWVRSKHNDLRESDAEMLYKD